jgi:hypothetical protein
MATRQDYETFQIDLFDIGDPSLCCYSYCCCYCASAHARTNLDGSSCCFNLFCLGPVVTRSERFPNISIPWLIFVLLLPQMARKDGLWDSWNRFRRFPSWLFLSMLLDQSNLTNNKILRLSSKVWHHFQSRKICHTACHRKLLDLPSIFFLYSLHRWSHRRERTRDAMVDGMHISYSM